MAIGQDLLNVPMGEMIYSMASSIAKSQIELDRASIEVAEMMGGIRTVYDDQGNVSFPDSRVFFGHEYMTLADAMITQSGNVAVDKLIAAQNLPAYQKYNGTLSDTTIEATAATTNNPATALTAAAVKAYQTNVKAINDRIAVLDTMLKTALAAIPQVQTTITALKAAIGLYETVKNNNETAVASVFKNQVQIPTRVSLLELGFTPTFYQFIDTIIEVKISITITQESSSTVTTSDTGTTRAASIGFRFTPFGRGRAAVQTQTNTSQVNASYSNRYSYTAEGSSLLRTKLTPLPPPAVLEERIRQMMAGDQARRAAMLGLLTATAGTA